MAVAAATINRHLSHPDGGWFAYAPNTGVTYSSGGRGALWREAAVWLAAIAAWSGISLWLYRSRPSD